MSTIKKFRIKSFKKKDPMISFRKIKMLFGKRIVLDEIDFDINKGEIFGMLGPNGVGKSTILNLITGILRPQSGSISIDGLDVTNLAINLRTRKFGVGYCPQYSGYFHDLTVEENLFAVGEILIKDKKDRKSKIDESIGYFELESVLKLKASNLSGGLKKRLAIALSLLGDPRILLLDEPETGLDSDGLEILKTAVLEDRNMTVIASTHDKKNAENWAENLMTIYKGQISPFTIRK